MSSEPAWPSGYGRIVLGTVDSTNAEAVRRAAATPPPFWVLARRQTVGRGRRGRGWATPTGNLAATLLMRPGGRATGAALRSFVAALALYDAFVAVTGRAQPFAIKWPNDVLLNGGKVAGILLESAGRGGRIEHLAIGIGVNLAEVPGPEALEPDAMRPVALLPETGAKVAAEEFLTHLAVAFATHEARLEEEGFAPIRAAWLACAARLGQTITARTASGGATTGRFETLDENGALILDAVDGRTAIAAADVFF